LWDAAYHVWRLRSTYERLEPWRWVRRDYSTPEAAEKSTREAQAQTRYQHDFAQDGLAFERLKRAHPHAEEAQLKQAIVAAVKFDDDCFKHFSYGGDYWNKVVQAVAQAAQDGPPYLETTYFDARNWVAYNMK
jgi:uncharacterized protein (DUF4415 family)